MKSNPSNPSDIRTDDVRRVSPKSFERARVLEVHSPSEGFHTATIKLYESGSQTTAPVLTSGFGDVSLPERDTDVIVVFGENNEEIIIGSWYPLDRIIQNQITVPDYEVGDRVVGNGSGSVLKIRDDGTIDLTTNGSKPLNTDHQSFSAYLATTQSISADSEERIEFDDTEHNYEGLYDTTTHEATLLNGGLYRLTGSAEIASAGQNNSYVLRLYRNNTVVDRSYQQSAVNSPLTMNVTTLEPMDEGDTIYMTLENTNGSAKDLSTGGEATSFDLRRQGPRR